MKIETKMSKNMKKGELMNYMKAKQTIASYILEMQKVLAFTKGGTTPHFKHLEPAFLEMMVSAQCSLHDIMTFENKHGMKGKNKDMISEWQKLHRQVFPDVNYGIDDYRKKKP